MSVNKSKELENSNLQAPYTQNNEFGQKSNYSKRTGKSNNSLYSGKSGLKASNDQDFSQNMIDNFAVKPTPTNLADLKKSSSRQSKGSLLNESNHDYNVPTLELLNPELYKENLRKAKIVKNATFESLKHIKERYSYHELRAQRAQKRAEEIGKELELKREEEMMKKRKRMIAK